VNYKGNAIPAANLSWLLTLRHCQGSLCHMHLITQTTGARGSFVVEAHGDANQFFYYALRLTVKDGCGRTNFAERGIMVSL
jgi:hypothetical protein